MAEIRRYRGPSALCGGTSGEPRKRRVAVSLLFLSDAADVVGDPRKEEHCERSQDDEPRHRLTSAVVCASG